MGCSSWLVVTISGISVLFCGEDEDRGVPNAGLSDRDDALRRLLFSELWEWSGKGSVSSDGLHTSSLSVCSVRLHGAGS